MPFYEYQARYSNGKKISGKIYADNPQLVADRLLSEKLIPIKIAKQKTRNYGVLSKLIGNNKLRRSELALLFWQLHALTKAGITLTDSLSRLAESSRKSWFAEILQDIALRLAAGNTLSSSMAFYSNLFSSLIVNSVASGEKSGQLEQTFYDMAKYLEFEARAVKRIAKALRYPIMVIGGIMAAIMILTVVVIPSYAKLFASLNAQLPLPTRVLLAISDFMISNGPWLMSLSIIGLIFFRYWSRHSGKVVWHSILLRMPIFGSIILRTLIARFTRLLAMLYRSGYAITASAQQIASAIGNAFVAEKCLEMATNIENGLTLTNAVKQINLMTPLTIQMIKVGEESGMLTDMLLYVAEFYEQEVDDDLDRLEDLLSPVIVIFLGIMVLVLALGVFLPMWQVIQVGFSA